MLPVSQLRGEFLSTAGGGQGGGGKEPKKTTNGSSSPTGSAGRAGRRRADMMKMDTLDTLIREDQAHLIHPLHYPKDHEHPIVMVEGRGAILKDLEGHEYIDGLSCLWNVNAGHGRAELAQAAAEQMARLAFVSTYAGTTNIPAIRLAERLVGLAYPNTSGVYFTTSGAESNESAFKAARYYWKIRGRPTKVKIFSRIHAYHGLTLGAMSATGMAAFHKMFGPLAPEFAQVEIGRAHV